MRSSTWNGTTIVGRLRVRNAHLEDMTARLRAASLLEAAQMHPTGLGPAAIICIRQLHDPLPGALGLHQGSMRPPAAWEQAVKASLDEAVRHAARPALGAVPASAAAVVFADQAELLACLAGNWCAGTAALHWWWQSLFRRQDITRALLNAWREAPEAIPAALAHLAVQSQAVPFARSVPTAEVQEWLQRVLHRFALHALGVALAPLVKSRDVVPTEDQPAPLLTSPWQRWVPEAQEAGLSLPARLLLGVGLMLQRAPTAIRASAFASHVARWAGTAPTAMGSCSPATSRSANGEEGPWGDAAKEGGGEPPPSLDTSPLVARPRPADPSLPRMAPGHARPPDWRRGAGPEEVAPVALLPHPPLLGNCAAPRPQRRAAALIDAHLARGTTPPTTVPPHGRAPREGARPPLPQGVPLGATIETRWGGIFYLLNLALYLGLYGDFLSPAEPGLELSPWDLLALLGTRLAGAAVRADPLWGLLAALGGRAVGEDPGAWFVPPEAWRVPEAWLLPFPSGRVWRWAAQNGRLRVAYPARFLVLDLPFEGPSPRQQVQQETQAYRASDPRLRRGAVRPPAGSSALTRWIDCLAAYTCARLRLAVGIQPARELGRFMCAHRARVMVTATRLDIMLRLDELPIQIRLAGLDRDPGWVPAAGRTIAFHFT